MFPRKINEASTPRKALLLPIEKARITLMGTFPRFGSPDVHVQFGQSAFDFLITASHHDVSSLFSCLFGDFLRSPLIESLPAFSEVVACFERFERSPIIKVSLHRRPQLESVMLRAFAHTFTDQVKAFGFSFMCPGCLMQNDPHLNARGEALVGYISGALPASQRAVSFQAPQHSQPCPVCTTPLPPLEGTFEALPDALIYAPLQARGFEGFCPFAPKKKMQTQPTCVVAVMLFVWSVWTLYGLPIILVALVMYID